MPLPAVLFKYLRRAAFIFAGLFLLLEAVLWTFFRAPVEPLKGLELRNDVAGFHKEVNFSFDRNLVRYLDGRNGSKSAGVVRLLCLGGAGTLGMFQNAEDTWWGALGRGLQAKGVSVEVAAWGQEYTGISSCTAVAARVIEDWQPDVVIGNFGFDDVVSHPLTYEWIPEKSQPHAAVSRLPGWKQGILTISQTARLFRKFSVHNDAATLQQNVGGMDYFKDSITTRKENLSQFAFGIPSERTGSNDPLQEYLHGWRKLADLAERQGATLIMTGEAAMDDSIINFTQTENLIGLIPVGTPPPDAKVVPIRPDPGWVERELGRYAESAEKLAVGRKLSWLNLNGRVPRDLDHFFTDVILTDAGAAIAAQELLPLVEPVVKAKFGPH